MGRPKTSSDEDFVKGVRISLALFENDFKSAMQRHEKPLKLSISNFTNRHNVSRSRLYRDFPDLLRTFQDAFLRLQQYESDFRKEGKSETLAGYRAKISRMKALHKAELSQATSLTVTKVIEQLGPAFREKLQLVRERQAHLETIQRLEEKIVRLQSLVRAQMQMLEQRENKI